MTTASAADGGEDPEGPVLLLGYAVSSLAGLGPEPVRVGPLAKINFLVGRNNHGKSTLLRASQLFAGTGADDEYVQAAFPDRSPGSGSRTRRQALVVLTDDDWPARPFLVNDWATFLGLADRNGLGQVRDGNLDVWVELGETAGAGPAVELLDIDKWAAALGQRPDSNDLDALLGPGVRRAATTAGRPRTIADSLRLGATRWALIPAFREIKDAGKTRSGKAEKATVQSRRLDDGTGLVRELQRWQSPDTAHPDHQQDEQRFRRLQELLRDVLEDPTARLHIPHNRRTAQIATVQSQGRRLDIDQLGDGIKQLLLIGAAALRHHNSLVCLEEPEIHLHPGLQRKLMAHLRERTTNQYLIATHSSHILDTPGAAVFHVVHDGQQTRVTQSLRVDALAHVGEDLGYRASDLLQANYVLWVEGPADRIYWRAWLALIDPFLEEGVHYTAMSYGGSLEAGLTLGPETHPPHEQDLADVLTLGRHCTLIADSDKDHPDAPLRPALGRLQDAADSTTTSHLLVLDHARTVENLLPPRVLTDAVRAAHPKAGAEFTATGNAFDDPYRNLAARPNKVRVARHAAPLLAPADIDAELRHAIEQTADRIRAANGLPARPETTPPEP